MDAIWPRAKAFYCMRLATIVLVVLYTTVSALELLTRSTCLRTEAPQANETGSTY